MTRRFRRTLNGLLGSRARSKAYAGLPFDPDDLERRLVWIFGSAGTSSTWLLQELCRPLRLDAAKPLGFEVNDGSTAGVQTLPIEDFQVTTHVAPMLGVPVERDGRLVPATLNNYLGVKPAYAFARDYSEVWGAAMRRLILVRANALETMAAREGPALARSPSILIEDPGGYATDVIMSLFPRARLVCLVRDGREALGENTSEAPSGGERESPPEVEARAKLWACAADAMTVAYGSHAPARRRIVRHEDLVADPASCIASLRDWLGLPALDRAPSPMPDQSTVPAPVWRELADTERTAAAEIMRPRLSALGYEW
jgi:hypothetical protein